jgi:hypothetical protein
VNNIMTEFSNDNSNEKERVANIAIGAFASASRLLEERGGFTRKGNGEEIRYITLTEEDIRVIADLFVADNQRIPNLVIITLTTDLAKVDDMDRVIPPQATLDVLVNNGPIEIEYIIRLQTDSAAVKFEKEVTSVDETRLDTAEDVRLSGEADAWLAQRRNAYQNGDYDSMLAYDKATESDAVLLQGVMDALNGRLANE